MWAIRSLAPGLLAQGSAPAPRATDLDPGQILVRGLAGGICGSDLPKFRRTGVHAHAPALWGYPLHEIVGEVVHSSSPDCAPGDVVVGWAARSQGLAEYVVVDETDVHVLRTEMAAIEAVIAQPLACSLSAVDRVDVRGRTVAILGLGGFGLLLAHLAKAHGAQSVVGIDPIRRVQAGTLGLDDVVEALASEGLARLGADGWIPEVVIEAVGHQTATVNDAIRGVAPGGSILCFGIPDVGVYPLEYEQVMRKNLTLVGSVTSDRVASLRKADRHLAIHRGLPAAVVSDVMAPRDAQAAYALAASPKRGLRKIVLDYDG